MGFINQRNIQRVYSYLFCTFKDESLNTFKVRLSRNSVSVVLLTKVIEFCLGISYSLWINCRRLAIARSLGCANTITFDIVIFICHLAMSSYILGSFKALLLLELWTSKLLTILVGIHVFRGDPAFNIVLEHSGRFGDKILALWRPSPFLRNDMNISRVISIGCNLSRFYCSAGSTWIFQLNIIFITSQSQ